MILAQAISAMQTVVILAYLLVIGYLGYLGYRRTQSSADYLIAGRQIHPFIMALSYGATFISTSAIVGFAGVAGLFGMSLLWLVFLNIFVGIFIAFVFFGKPTRQMGHHLNAHTFPELLGLRFDSAFIQVFSGALIALFIPLYAAAVMIGGCEFISTHFNIDYTVALLIFGVIIGLYVVMGGLKGIMYTDALQGAIMMISMIALLICAYRAVGGVTAGHAALTDMADEVFVGFKAMGHRGWTAMPEFGWGDKGYNLWWIVVSNITLGVGIGVLAQPQLIVRFMTVKSTRELNRAVPLGGLFILLIPGTVYVVGSLSNVYFSRIETVTGTLTKTSMSVNLIVSKNQSGEKTLPCDLLHVDTTGDGTADVHVIARGLDKAAAIMPTAEVTPLDDGRVTVRPRATSFMRSVVPLGEDRWMLNPDSVMPTYIKSAMPHWFGLIFLLTLLSAAMSTLSSQFHALGTSLSHDVYGRLSGRKIGGIGITRVGIILGILLAVIISSYARGGYFIARATAMFFGLCASTFLPSFIGGLFFKRMTRTGAIASMLTGSTVTLFWLIFIKAKEAGTIGIVQKVTGGKTSLLADYPNWPEVDPILIALPMAILAAIVVSMMTKKLDQKHIDHCFGARLM